MRRLLDTGLAWAIGGLLAAMVVNVLWQVASRFLLGVPSSFTEELARYLTIWLGLLGGAYGVGRGLHLSLGLLRDRAGGFWAPWLSALAALSVLGFALGALVWGGGRLVWITHSLGQTSAALEIDLGHVYLALPLAGLCMTFYALADLVALAAGNGAPEGRQGGDAT